MDDLPPRRNIELKARCRDLDAAREAARRLGAVFSAVLEQCDTYFHCPRGRLKLRETAGRPAELIAYERGDATASRQSEYHLVPVPEPAALRAALASALGERGQVRKRRELWMWRGVRIHLDEVEGLGRFVEFEAVLAQGGTDAVGHEKISLLQAALGIGDADLLGASYADSALAAV